MRTIKTAAGTAIELDGDALAVLEAISRDLVRLHGLEYGFEDVEREFQHIVAQLTPDELRDYLKEALVMSFVRYENDRLMEMVRRATRESDDGAAP